MNSKTEIESMSSFSYTFELVAQKLSFYGEKRAKSLQKLMEHFKGFCTESTFTDKVFSELPDVQVPRHNREGIGGTQK